MRFVVAISAIFVAFKGLLLLLRGERSENLFDVGNFWILGPAILFLYSAVRLLRKSGGRSALELSIMAWYVVLAFHFLYNVSLHGMALAIYSFLPWGVWTALGVWGSIERDRKLDAFLSGVIVVIGLGYAISVLYEFATGEILFRVANRVTTKGFFRYSGLTSSPVQTGLALSCGLFSVVWIWLHARAPSMKIGAAIAGAVMIVASVLCLGRLALIAGAIGFIAIARSQLKQSWLMLIGAGALVVFSMFALGEFLTENQSFEYLFSAFSLGESGNLVRLETYKDQLALLMENLKLLFLGSGSGSTGVIAAQIQGTEETTESSMLRLLREFGVVGAFPFFAIVILTFVAFFRARAVTMSSRSSVVFTALFGMIVLQASFAEALDGWVSSFFFWACVCVACQLEPRRNVHKFGSRVENLKPHGAMGLALKEDPTAVSANSLKL